jgi:DNA primase
MEIWGTPIIAEVEEIVDLLRVEIRSQGVDLLKDMKPTHNNIMLTCIAHGDGTEKKPSLGVTTIDVFRNGKTYKAGTCNCFTCGYTVDLPEFISNVFGHNDKGMFGYKWLTQNFVNLSIEKRKPLELNMSRDIDEADLLFDETILEDELAKYRFTHPYMYERKLTDKVIEYFDVGFDTEKNALTFPVFDSEGDVKLIQRRSVASKQFINDEGANKGNYIYGLYQVIKNLSWIKELYICESPIDALTCWSHRVPAVALMGASITATQVKLLRDLPVRKLISALDNDKAGQEGSEKLVKYLGDVKVIFRLQFPEDVKDVNAMTEEQFQNRSSVL